MAFRSFNHLNVPEHWERYFTKYPQGMTILEALFEWVSQVDSMVDNQNKLNTNVEQFRKEIDAFVERFDGRLQDEVTKTLKDWQDSGFLDVVISEALQWELDNYIATNEQDKLSLAAQLSQIAVNILDFGAVANNSTFDNVAPIQNAIDHVHGMGGGNVLIPSGVFHLNSVNGSRSVMLRPRSNVNIIGHGHSSILKAADGLNHIGTFNVIRHTADDSVLTVDNVMFKDFTIDCNGHNNIIIEGDPNKDNVAIGIWRGSNIIVENIKVLDNVGRQTFSFGANVSPHSIKNVSIKNCLFLNTTNNQYQTDHSTIYCQSDGAIIADNTFKNLYISTTAIENHSSNSYVLNNVIENFKTGINVVAQVTDQINGYYQNNVMRKVWSGFVFWLNPGFNMENIHIDNNDMKSIDNRPRLMNLDSSVKKAIKNIFIVNNNFEYVGDNFTVNSPAIALGRLNECYIRNNTFKNLPSRAIDVQTLEPNSKIYIDNNRLLDCCKGKITNYTQAFAFYSGVKIKVLEIVNNEIENKEDLYMTKLVDGNANVDYLKVVDNTVINVQGSHISWNATSTFIDSLIRHIGDGSPENTIPANIGSSYMNRMDNINYVKKLQNNQPTGWRKEYIAIAPPETGSHKTLDIVYNNNPLPGNHIGWIYTANGWKTFGQVGL